MEKTEKEGEQREETLKEEVQRMKKGIDLLNKMFESASEIYELERREEAKEELMGLTDTLTTLLKYPS